MEIKKQENNKHFSFTQLNMFLRCPKQYYYRYIENKKIPPSGAMFQSSVIHKMLEHNYKQKLETYMDVSIPYIFDLFIHIFEESLINNEVNIRNKKEKEDLINTGKDILLKFIIEICPSVRPKHIEKTFEIKLQTFSNYSLIGVWDVIDENNVIIDNKVYSKKVSQTQIDNDLQLSIYSLAYRLLNKQKENNLRLDIVVKNSKLNTQQLTTTRSYSDIMFTIEVIQKAIKAIKKGIFVPNPNSFFCSKDYCGYFNICRRQTYKNFDMQIIKQ